MQWLYSVLGASGAGWAGAGWAAASAGAAAASSAAAFLPFLAPSRGTNFFLGLGNSKDSPLGFCAVPPAAVIFSWADLLYQPATTVSFFFSSPSPRIFTGCR